MMLAFLVLMTTLVVGSAVAQSYSSGGGYAGHFSNYGYGGSGSSYNSYNGSYVNHFNHGGSGYGLRFYNVGRGNNSSFGYNAWGSGTSSHEHRADWEAYLTRIAQQRARLARQAETPACGNMHLVPKHCRLTTMKYDPLLDAK